MRPVNMSCSGICRLCLNNVVYENDQFVKEATKRYLDFLSIKLDLFGSNDRIICSVCYGKLLAAFEFKSTCMRIDAGVTPYVGCNNQSGLDLRDIYLKENKYIVTPSEHEKICRLCMELAGEAFVPVQDIQMDGLQELLPEINVNIIKDAVVCKSCFESLETHSNFLKNCLRIQGVVEDSARLPKVDHTDTPFVESLIKTEELYIKSEGPFSYVDVEQVKMETEKSDQMCFEGVYIKQEIENDIAGDMSSTSENCPVASVKSEGQTKPSGCETKVCLQNDHIRKNLYKCDMCDYSTTLKTMLKCHQVKHKDSLQMAMQKCNGSEMQIYKCDICDYKTRIMSSLKVHQMIHDVSSNVHFYKCGACDYRTKYKNTLKTHQLKHKDHSQVETYKCHACDYETKYKNTLKRHELVHKDPSQVEMHKCDTCDYKTRFKGNLKIHQVVHKDPSEMQMFKCDICGYETKRKNKHKTHLLIHKDPSQVQMYKCDSCHYETKIKARLKLHQLVHKDPSQVEMHKCETCDYRTKHKYYLKRHQSIHKDYF